MFNFTVVFCFTTIFFYAFIVISFFPYYPILLFLSNNETIILASSYNWQFRVTIDRIIVSAGSFFSIRIINMAQFGTNRPSPITMVFNFLIRMIHWRSVHDTTARIVQNYNSIRRIQGKAWCIVDWTNSITQPITRESYWIAICYIDSIYRFIGKVRALLYYQLHSIGGGRFYTLCLS